MYRKTFETSWHEEVWRRIMEKKKFQRILKKKPEKSNAMGHIARRDSAYFHIVVPSSKLIIESDYVVGKNLKEEDRGQNLFNQKL